MIYYNFLIIMKLVTLTNVLSRHQAGDVVWVGLREFGDTESHGEHLNEVANDYFTFY